VILGQDLARASKAEERHRASAGDVRSPLDGIGYDIAKGAFDLHRFVESPVDRKVQVFLTSLRRMSRADVANGRSALRMDDLYTLITFVRRGALAAVSSGSEPSIDDAVRALLMIDEERVDWRDLAGAGELLAWAMSREGRDHHAEFHAVADELGLQLEQTVAATAARPADELEPSELLVKTPTGVGFADSWFEAYAPTVDLVGIAFAVQDVLEADVYRGRSLTVEARLPEVWLSPRDDPAVADALASVVAAVNLDADLDPTVSASANGQRLVVFLAETVNESTASTLAAAAIPTSSFEALGVAAGPVVCVVVASSMMVGTKPYEGAGALARFSDPIRAVLPRPGSVAGNEG
jgi:hypothetical protein